MPNAVDLSESVSVGRRSWLAVARDSRVATGAVDAIALAYLRSVGGRDGDVYLCSYPRSGRTWLRFLLTDYQLRLAGVPYPLNFNNFPELSPNVTILARFRPRRARLEERRC